MVQFFEKKRKKAGAGLGWVTGGKADVDVCWERWSLEVPLATPKTDVGEWLPANRLGTVLISPPERTKVMSAMASTLQRTSMRILTIVNREKEHIPPITTSDANPFPYSVELNPRVEGWSRGTGIHG